MTENALAKKLRLKEDQKILVMNAPEGFFAGLAPFSGLIETRPAKEGTMEYDFVLLFIHNSAELEQYGASAIGALKKDGILWFAYPKKSSGIRSDLSRDEGWDFLNPYKLSGVSNVAIDDTWSALRFRQDPEGKNHQQQMDEYRQQMKENRENKERTVDVPADFQQALAQNPMARAVFDKFAYTHKKEYVRWIEEAKKQETRERRIEKAIEKIAGGTKFS